MRVLSSLFVVLAGIVAVSHSSPLPVLQQSASLPSLQTFNTGPKPTNRYDIIRPTPYRRHRDIKLAQQARDVSSYTRIFWAFGDSEPKPSDLPPVQDVLGSMTTQQTMPSPGITLIPSPTVNPPININPVFQTPHLPLASIPTATATLPLGTNENNSENPAAAAALAHKHKIVFVAVVVGTITGLGITVSVCKFLAKSGLCSCGGREFTGAGRVEDKEKKLSWMKLNGPPLNFGARSLMAGVGMPGKVTMFGRHYDDKGIERNPNHKGVSFEDDHKVIDIGHEFSKPDLHTLAYQPPMNNASAVSTKPGISEPCALGLKVGQTLNPAHFTTHHLSPTSFFDNDDHVVSASPSRLSNISSSHSRTKSAPVVIRNGHQRRESNKSGALSSASSEWDVARAYGGPRYDKARSTGAMSGLSTDEREWDRIRRISDRSSR